MASTDVVSAAKRSEMMAGIGGRNTKPELVIRRGLHAKGFRFRLHYRKLPGKPDLAFPRLKAVILVHGCFWHGHGCHLFKWPSTRAEFWRQKIMATKDRDQRHKQMLDELGWRVLIIWECALKGRTRWPEDIVICKASEWLSSASGHMVIKGNEDVAD